MPTFWDNIDKTAWRTAAAIKNIIRRDDDVRTSSEAYREQPQVLAYHLDGRGMLHTIKSIAGSIFGGFGGLGVNNYEITSSKEGYARAYVASVWANRCIEIQATIVSQMPFFITDMDTGEAIENHPLEVALKRAREDILHRWVMSRLVWGETFLLPYRNRYGYFSDIKWLNNLGMEINDAGGYISSYFYSSLNGGAARQFSADEVVYFRVFNPFDDIRGLSKLETVLLEVGIDQDISRVTRTFFINDARPGLLLIPENDLSTAESQAFMDFWRDNFRGSKNAGKPVLLPKNIREIRPMERAPSGDDVQLREATRREICAAFGIPLSIAGAWDDANYQSAPEQRRSMYEDTIFPLCRDIQREVNRDLMPLFEDERDVMFEFDFTKVLALMEDEAKKVTTANSQLLSGALTLNEYRTEQGYPELPNGDVYYVPAGVQVVKAADIGTMPSPQPLPTFGGLRDADAEQLTEVEAAQKSGSEMYIGLRIADNPNMVALQNRIKAYCGDIPVRWHDPRQLYITLVYAPSVTEEQVAALSNALGEVSLPALSLSLGSLKVFDNMGDYALYLYIRRNLDLNELQASVYDICQALDIPVSAYSLPANFAPHITMGYAERKPRPVTFSSKLMLEPDAMVLHIDDTAQTELSLKAADFPDDLFPPTNPVEEVIAEETPDEAQPPTVKHHFNWHEVECTCQPLGAASVTPAFAELSRWQKAALNSVTKGQKFVAYTVSSVMADTIRNQLAAAADRDAIKAVFNAARDAVKADVESLPAEYVEYWRSFDDLMAEIGAVWLNDYMVAAGQRVSSRLRQDMDIADLDGLLDARHDDLVDAWVGDADSPGAMLRIFLAGVASGDKALQRRVDLNPRAKAVVGIDWNLLNQEALDFVRNYAFDLVSNLDETTLLELQRIFTAWVESGEPLSALQEQVETLFKSPVRAEMIAQTESTRLYNEGNNKRWAASGVEKVTYRSVRDNRVSDVCKQLDGKVGTIEQGFYSKILNKFVRPPSHVRCRSYTIPNLDDSAVVNAVPGGY